MSKIIKSSSGRKHKRNPIHRPTGPKQGLWKLDPNLSNDNKQFNKWETRLYRGPIWRYYVPNAMTPTYYDNVTAVIHLYLKTDPTSPGKQDMADLVFVDEKDLPIDLTQPNKGLITLFFPAAQFPEISGALETYKAGLVDWLYFTQQISNDQIQGFVIGQLRFQS